jgi:hypothetical protein
VHDWRDWATLWEKTRLRLAEDTSGMKPRRWTGQEEPCAGREADPATQGERLRHLLRRNGDVIPGARLYITASAR